MKKLWLSENMIGDSFWSALNSSLYGDEASKDASKIAQVTAPLVDDFPSIAGSISLKSSTILWLLTRYFSPVNIVEIGTYIGRSTLSMSFGGIKSVKQIYTCDGTFDCMPFEKIKNEFVKEKQQAISKISYFGKTMSFDLMGELKSSGEKTDFVFIDGRLSSKDCELLKEIKTNDCVLILDDFDGVEKGVINAMMLRDVFRNYILIQSSYNMAIMVPSESLSLSRQQSLPVNM